LGNLGFQGAEPLPHGLEIVAQPHDSHARRRHRLALREQFVGDSELAPRRLVDGHRDDHRFQLRDHPVLQIRFAAADLLQAFLARPFSERRGRDETDLACASNITAQSARAPTLSRTAMNQLAWSLIS
jgi:hypothetical protein